MKAARWHGVKDIRVEDIPDPEPGKGEVKIKVAWTGICGSDLHEYLAGPIFVPVGDEHPLSHDKAPITMGHEYCGTVTELGEGVTGLAIGDRVAIEPIFACGICSACLEGTYNLCDSLGFVGLSGGHGGFAAHSVVPARMVHKMPDGLSMEQGALVEPAAVALHAVRLSKIKAGDMAQSASRRRRKAACTRQRASSRRRDAGPPRRAPLVRGHDSGCTKRTASCAGREPSGAVRDAGCAGYLTLARSRAAGRAKRSPKDAMRDAENAGRVALSALLAAFAKGRQIGLSGRFSTLSTSP